ncbi:MAG: glutaminase A [Methylacidiphilales bacterium]|nr:glutaminase A [Candidatus Methylacidiphilales bacterium]
MKIVSPIQKYLEELHARLLQDRSGEVATYIPELGKANPEWFGICVVTADGEIYTAGDTDQTFTIQSISKPFVYGVALEDNGQSEVLKKIWMEPSGEAFNAISLRPGTGQPANPMINAGAIATAALVEGKTQDQKIHRILDAFGRYAGRALKVDPDTYRSESETGFRNRAIGWLLRNFSIIGDDPTPALEAYFMQCSILANCRDLGIMAATLANGGINPLTQKRAVMGEYVEKMISVMNSCGMYDAAGEWMFNVGMPAKSGVAGGILAVLPGQLGIGVFSPRLDTHGNSVRGIEVCRELSREFNLHLFHVLRPGRSVIRRCLRGSEVGSNMLRNDGESASLKEHGDELMLIEMQGELTFTSTEVVVRRAVNAEPAPDHVLLDFAHVEAVDLAAARLLSDLAPALSKAGRQLVFTRLEHLSTLGKVLKKAQGDLTQPLFRIVEDGDLALEWCENQILDRYAVRNPSDKRVELHECELLKGLERKAVAVLLEDMKECKFKEGEVVVKAGDPADALFFLLKGTVSVWIPLPSGKRRRVATFSPGMVFGEMAVLDRLPRSADVTADTKVECLSLTVDALEKLSASRPTVLVTLLRNLALVISHRMRKSNIELGTLHR